MSGMNKRSTDPKADQKKLKVNPAYGSFGLIKSVGDVFKGAGDKKKKKK